MTRDASFAFIAIAIAEAQLLLDRGQRHDWFDSAETRAECGIALMFFHAVPSDLGGAPVDADGTLFLAIGDSRNANVRVSTRPGQLQKAIWSGS